MRTSGPPVKVHLVHRQPAVDVAGPPHVDVGPVVAEHEQCAVGAEAGAPVSSPAPFYCTIVGRVGMTGVGCPDHYRQADRNVAEYPHGQRPR